MSYQNPVVTWMQLMFMWVRLCPGHSADCPWCSCTSLKQRGFADIVKNAYHAKVHVYLRWHLGTESILHVYQHTKPLTTKQICCSL